MEKLIDYRLRNNSLLEMTFLNGDGLYNNITILIETANSISIERYLDNGVKNITLSIAQRGTDLLCFDFSDEQSMKNMEEIYTLLTQI